MGSVHFADILFTFIVLAITFAILWMVNKVRNKKGPSEEHTNSVGDQENNKG